MFATGVAIFTVGSALCACAGSPELLIAARAVQGVGGAIIAPLSLTILTAATPAERRGRVIGAWGATAAGAASLGPAVGGAVTSAVSWHAIFWLGVPVGVVLVPLSRYRLTESFGSRLPLDGVGVGLSAGALLALVWGLIQTSTSGWASARALVSIAAGCLMLAMFVAWERRVAGPMVPMRFFRSRAFSAATAASLLGYFAFLGAVFLLAQLFQIGLRASPVHAGLEVMALTATAVVVAPRAGALCDRTGPRPLLVGALALEAVALGWIAAVARPGVDYPELVPALVLLGAAAAGLFAPVQAALLGAVRVAELGQASGVATVVRELGGVLGVAVLAGVFAVHGGVGFSRAFLAGVRPALVVAAIAASAAATRALGLPRRAGQRPRALQTSRSADGGHGRIEGQGASA